MPPIPGLENVPYETNETLFDLRDLPKHLLIIGGGPIGMEMAQAHVRLGVEGDGDRRHEGDGQGRPRACRDRVWTVLRAEGVEIAEDAMAAEIRGKAGAIEVEAKDGRVFKGTHLLMAVGRKANIERYGTGQGRRRT